MKLRKSQAKLQKRIYWYDTEVDKTTSRAKPGRGCDSPVSVYHRPGSNKK